MHESHNTPRSLTVAPGKKWSGRFGTLSHATMVGRNFGCKLLSDDGKGFIYLLRPSAELWTASVSHRTQILYKADIAMICLQLELLPGCVVIEAGTGSGSLSHMIARCVGASGTLHTFEYNAQRAEPSSRRMASAGASTACTTSGRHADVHLRPAAPMAGRAPASPRRRSTRAHLRPAAAVGRGAARRAVRQTKNDALMQAVEQIQRTEGHSPRGSGGGGGEVLRRRTLRKAPPQNDADAAVARSGGRVRNAATRAAAAVEAMRTAEPAPPSKRQKEEGAAGGQPSSAAGGRGKRRRRWRWYGKSCVACRHCRGSCASRRHVRIAKPNDDMRGHTGFLMFCTKMIKRSAEELAALEAEEAAEAEAASRRPSLRRDGGRRSAGGGGGGGGAGGGAEGTAE